MGPVGRRAEPPGDDSRAGVRAVERRGDGIFTTTVNATTDETVFLPRRWPGWRCCLVPVPERAAAAEGRMMPWRGSRRGSDFGLPGLVPRPRPRPLYVAGAPPDDRHAAALGTAANSSGHDQRDTVDNDSTSRRSAASRSFPPVAPRGLAAARRQGRRSAASRSFPPGRSPSPRRPRAGGTAGSYAYVGLHTDSTCQATAVASVRQKMCK